MNLQVRAVFTAQVPVAQLGRRRRMLTSISSVTQNFRVWMEVLGLLALASQAAGV